MGTSTGLLQRWGLYWYHTIPPQPSSCRRLSVGLQSHIRQPAEECQRRNFSARGAGTSNADKSEQLGLLRPFKAFPIRIIIQTSHFASPRLAVPLDWEITMGLSPSVTDGLIQTEYYQHVTHPTSDVEEPSWRMTDFGNVGEFSRDGSIHATDEVFNAASHLAALILSVLGSAILIVDSSAQGEPWKIVSFAIYGASLIFLFSASTLHHAIEGPWERFLRMLDYFAIYPLIAGTFTPLCLVFYHDQPVGWTFFGTIWGLSIIGMILTASCFAKVPKWFSMTLYISLGWLGACFSYWVSGRLNANDFLLNAWLHPMIPQ